MWEVFFYTTYGLGKSGVVFQHHSLRVDHRYCAMSRTISRGIKVQPAATLENLRIARSVITASRQRRTIAWLRLVTARNGSVSNTSSVQCSRCVLKFHSDAPVLAISFWLRVQLKVSSSSTGLRERKAATGCS